MDRLRTVYRPDLSMPRGEGVERWIEGVWQTRHRSATRTGTPLFNGPLFRLAGHHLDPGSGDLHVLLGPTDYRDYVATRTNRFFAGRWREELANPLAVCCVVETADGRILIGRRGNLDVYPGRFHLPGGFAERRGDVCGAAPDLAAEVLRETREELGQDLSSGVLRVLGLLYDLDTPHTELVFHVRTPLDWERSVDVFQGAAEQEVLGLHPLESQAEVLASFIQEHHGAISVTGEGALVLFGAIRHGAPWADELARRLME